MFDLHAHPSLKTYLFKKKFHKRYPSGGAWNPFAMRVSLPRLIDGQMSTLVSAIYLPEKKMINDCWFLKFLSFMPFLRLRKLMKKNPYEATVMMLDQFERAVEKSARPGKPIAQIAKSKSELYNIRDKGNIAILHSIEGGHSLNGKLQSVKDFYDRGVCMLTPAHFYENALGQTVGGIPENKKMLFCFKNEKSQKGGLTTFGKEVIESMISLGMIVDLTHCTPLARDEIFAMNQKRRPLVFSHVGVYSMNPTAMNPTDDEIKALADTGGAIGVIFMNYWLKNESKKKGLDHIINTIKHIRKTGGIDSVAIGSDFDGFTDPPDDIKNASCMPKLIRRLETDGFMPQEIEKITSTNMLRVIDTGWDK